ncbi:MAG: hypothetical protein JOY54_07245 [Acidobacteriaceae bacterium]|nr:hypothetical protein [Acidobacteriaceae bacterium]
MAKKFARAFVCFGLAVAVAYAADYGILRYRVAANRMPFGTVTVQPYDAVPQKDNKIEYLPEDPQDETCVHSLFPHMGDTPCWYLTRHREKRINF